MAGVSVELTFEIRQQEKVVFYAMGCLWVHGYLPSPSWRIDDILGNGVAACKPSHLSDEVDPFVYWCSKMGASMD